MPAEAVRDLFQQCATVVAIGSGILFSYFPVGKDGRPDVGRWSGMLLWSQKQLGEPWLWSMQPEKLDQYLEELGWTLSPSLTEKSMKQGVEFYAVATLKL